MTHAILKKELVPQPVLVVRRRVKPGDLAKTLAEELGEIFLCAQRNGMAVSGQPFTRFIACDPGLWTIEAGLPVATIEAGTPPSGSKIRTDTLPGGSAATLRHTGPYEGLRAAHVAVQRWIQEQGFVEGGAPWEVYVTDPADYPDPKDWNTDIFWPLASPPSPLAADTC